MLGEILGSKAGLTNVELEPFFLLPPRPVLDSGLLGCAGSFSDLVLGSREPRRLGEFVEDCAFIAPDLGSLSAPSRGVASSSRIWVMERVKEGLAAVAISDIVRSDSVVGSSSCAISCCLLDVVAKVTNA